MTPPVSAPPADYDARSWRSFNGLDQLLVRLLQTADTPVPLLVSARMANESFPQRARRSQGTVSAAATNSAAPLPTSTLPIIV